MPTTQPQLGYGKQTEASIDQVNQWMRSQPWWQQIKGNSQDIGPQQKQAILRAAQQNGVVVDEGDMEIDKAGNFNPKGHKLRNTLIVAGIAGAALAAPYAIPAMTGGGGTAAGTTAAATAAGGTAAGTTAAAAGTGGILSQIGTIGSALSPVLGGMAARGAQNNALNDVNQQEAWRQGEAANLSRDKFAISAPQDRLGASTKASILSNYTPTKVNWGGPGSGLRGELPTYSGGMSGAMGNLDPRTKDLASQLMDDMLAQQQARRGSTVSSPQPVMGRSSGLDRAVGTGATITSILGALGGSGILNRIRRPGATAPSSYLSPNMYAK